MHSLIQAFEAFFGGLPLPFLQVWGGLAYIVGCVLAVAAFGGFTFKPGGIWGLGREQQAWDAKAILSIPITFALIILTGYLGSFIVLVPEAQTFESLKDLVVLQCLLLFGYPALLTVPFAYGLSDLIEGVPPSFLLDWLPGYFINPACFWIAYQLIGKDPDFRRARTWGLYLAAALAFLALEPVLWGYICSDKFTPAIAYRSISAALFFTTSLTWALGPLAMLAALPLARRWGLFWAEIPGHVKERVLGAKAWAWEAGLRGGKPKDQGLNDGWPIRMVILTPFIALVLLMVGTTAYVTLRSAQEDAQKLASRLHDAVSVNIDLLLDEHLAQRPSTYVDGDGMSALLKELPIARHGLALVIDRSKRVIASTAEGHPAAAQAIEAFSQASASASAGGLPVLSTAFRFDHITERPLGRVTWLGRGTPYKDRRGGHSQWTVLTLLPETSYLAGVQKGNSRSAMVFALALLLSVAVAALLAAGMTRGLKRIMAATQSMARGDLAQQVPGSKLVELDSLASSFNDMARNLADSMAELRANERRMLQEMRFTDALMDSLPAAVLLFDATGKFLKWNKVLEQVSGYSAEELGRMGPQDLMSADYAPAAMRSVENVLGKGHDEVEIPLLTKDRRTIPYYLKGVRQVTERGPCILVIGLDVSERRRLEEQFRQAQKMEAVGSLAGGIAHDFNNILTVILGFSRLLENGMLADDPRRADIGEIVKAGNHATDLTRQLLAFSRKQVLQPVLTDLNINIREMQKMLRRIIGEDIQLETRLDPGPVHCKADHGQFEQAILNLAVNARDAMPQGGKLSIGTKRLRIDEDYCHSHPGARVGDYIQVSISDTGVGMSPEVRARVFEPFFTTKGLGKGTGLGLPMVYGMLQQSGGFIEVESEPGQGSSFKLHFPATGEAEAAQTAGQASIPATGGQETVLLVEDEDAVRRMASRTLQSFGYTVLEAANGKEALKLLGSEAPSVDLLLTDVVMPELSGPALAKIVNEQWPGLPVLFCSGHTDDAVLKHGLLHEQIEFIAKPYSPEALAKKVREVLDKRP